MIRTSSHSIGRVARGALALVVFTPAFAGSLMAQPADPGKSTQVFSPDDRVLGKDLDEWSAEWQKWFISIPASQNPAFDNGPCNTAQSGPVWFIPSGSNVSRQCTVQKEKLILISIINAECSSVEAPPFFGATKQARSLCAATLIDGVSTPTVKFSIDGVPLSQLRRFRVESDQYRFTMPATDNVLGVTSGATSGLSVSDGYFLLVRLSPGSHVIHSEASIVSGPGAGYSQNTTYMFYQM